MISKSEIHVKTRDRGHAPPAAGPRDTRGMKNSTVWAAVVASALFGALAHADDMTREQRLVQNAAYVWRTLSATIQAQGHTCDDLYRCG